MTRTARTGIAAALVVAAGLATPAVAAAHPQPSRLSQPSQPTHPWDRYNLAPASRTVGPRSVTRTTGSVSAPTAVLHGRSTVVGAGASITLDFGEEVGGLVTLHFAAGSGQLGLAFSESVQYIGPVSDASNGGSGTDGAIYADAAPGTSWTMPAAALRGGFRYLTLFAGSSSVAVDRVSLAISFTPTMTNLRDYPNYFYSSDPLLNRIWYAGAYTVQTNTIAPNAGRVWGPPATGWDNSATVGVGDEVLVDGAKRDRTVWPGDLGVSVPTEYASLGDLAPTRNALTTLYQHQQPSGELPFAGPEVNFYGSDTYHLWTLIGTANYYEYSRDNAWLATEWTNYQRALEYSLGKVGDDGLMSVTGTNDWARGDQGGENIEANALLYQALTTGAELAGVEGDAAHAASWRGTAARLKTAVNDQLWDAAAGQYRDNPTSGLHPQDGNSLAVWYGLAPPDRARRVTAALQLNWNAYGATTPEKNGEVGTFPGSMEVQAHLAAGDTVGGLDLIRREWGYMLDSPLGTGSTFWEGYLADGQFGYGGAYMSAAHGWSTGPTSALTFYVLGIRPTSATGAYEIAPSTGDLASAQGSLATPLGRITLAWSHDVRHRTFTEHVDAAPGAVGDVRVPTFGARSLVWVNGRLVWNGHSGMAYGAHLDGDDLVLGGTPAHSTILSQAVGQVPATLDITPTATTDTPVRAGQTVTIPVTVTATGGAVLRGTVRASGPSGWTSDPAPFTVDPRSGPADTVVNVTVHPPPTLPGGPVTVPLTASAGRVRASTSVRLLAFGDWPAGTTATASSFHAPNIVKGQQRTYDPGNAIDDDLATFWNDDTSGAFPDALTVTAPSPIPISGVGFASIVDRVPTDFAIQTWDGTQWSTQATVTANDALYRWIAFPAEVTTSQVRIVVSADQLQNGAFTRVAELTP